MSTTTDINIEDLAAEAARLLAGERLADGSEVLPDDFESTIKDATWLGAVALLVTDRDVSIQFDDAVEAVHANEHFLLAARAEGFEAWEVAAYAGNIAEEMSR